MDKSAIIITDDSQGKFSEDKGLLKLKNEPLLNHVVNAVKGVVDEVVVVTTSKEQADLYAKIVPSNIRFAVNFAESKGTLIEALTGFEAVKGKYSMLWPFDAPLVPKEVVSLLFELCIGKSAVVPRWPSNEIEPLHAVYHTQQALKAAKTALASNELDLGLMVSKMRGVRYLSTIVIKQLDPDFRAFFRVNTPLDLKKAALMEKQRKRF